MSNEEQQMDDEALLRCACLLTKEAQKSGDPRILQLMQQAIDLMGGTAIVPTLLLRYEGLLDENKELEEEIDRSQDVRSLLRKEAS